MAVSTLQGYIELRHSSFLPCGPRWGGGVLATSSRYEENKDGW